MARFNANKVRMTGDEIDLSMQRGHPEGMDDIPRFQLNGDGRFDWDMNFVRSGHLQRRIVVEVMNLPPPLVANHENLRF